MNDPRPAKKTKKSARKKTRPRSSAAVAATNPTAAPQKGSGMTMVIVAALALAVGGGGGWYLRHKRAEAVAATPDDATAPTGSAATCTAWAEEVCKGVGLESESCEQSRAAAALLTDDACGLAMKNVATTVDKAKRLRSVCDQLVAKLCKDIGEETDTCKMVREQTPALPTSKCQELMAGYDELLPDLEREEKMKQPLTPELAKKIASGDVPSFGPDDAVVTVVEFSDFECPYCGQAAEAVTALKKKYEGKKVRVVFRQFPLLSIHPDAQLAAEASLAAHAQGKFWAFHDQVFRHQEEGVGRAQLEKHAEAAGLDLAKFKKALDDHTYAAAVKADLALGEEIFVNGTPTVIVGTERVAEPSLEAISSAIDAQLDEG